MPHRDATDRSALIRRRGPVAALVMLSLFSMVPPASATEEVYQVKTYHLANGIGALSSSGFNIGGVWFEGHATKPPTRVVAADANGSPVRIRVAQDLNNNFQHGDPGEPVVTGCGSVDLSSSQAPFVAGRPIAVFVSIAYVGCTAVGTTGTLTLFVAAD
ncbi:MAG: hypothetical protein ACLGH3_04640 [Actinomycetota bacterium]